jgi:hypothetical protein
MDLFMQLDKLPLIKSGYSVNVRSDRFEVRKQEISFLESKEFIKVWNEVMDELDPLANDKNIQKIFWRAHIADFLFENSFSPGHDMSNAERMLGSSVESYSS